jgi:hypothetical protein
MAPTDPNTLAADSPATTPMPTDAPVDPLSEPTFEECIVAWNEYSDLLKAGRFNDVDIPVGHHFAYYGGRIVDHDPDYMALCARAAAKAGVHWARLVIAYHREPSILL